MQTTIPTDTLEIAIGVDITPTSWPAYRRRKERRTAYVVCAVEVATLAGDVAESVGVGIEAMLTPLRVGRYSTNVGRINVRTAATALSKLREERPRLAFRSGLSLELARHRCGCSAFDATPEERAGIVRAMCAPLIDALAALTSGQMDEPPSLAQLVELTGLTPLLVARMGDLLWAEGIVPRDWYRGVSGWLVDAKGV